MMPCEDSLGSCSGLSLECSGDALGMLRDVSERCPGGSQGTHTLHTTFPPLHPHPFPPAAGREPGTVREGGTWGKWAGKRAGKWAGPRAEVAPGFKRSAEAEAAVGAVRCGALGGRSSKGVYGSGGASGAVRGGEGGWAVGAVGSLSSEGSHGGGG